MNPSVATAVADLRAAIESNKTNDRSAQDRRCQIVLTDLEKLEALCVAWLIQ